MEAVEIVGRKIGREYAPLLIADPGVNHNGNIDITLALVDAAAQSEADAVKFQTFSADCLITKQTPKAKYQLETTNEHESEYQMLKNLEFSETDHCHLLERCQQMRIFFLSSSFDGISVDLLESLNVPAHKIPSGEITNLPYLAHVARRASRSSFPQVCLGWAR